MQIYLEDYMSELTNIENGKVKLSLKIPAEDYRRALESAYRRTGAHYNIPGFRKGKVPRKVIEATYGVNVFWDEEFDSLVQSVYSDALAEHNLVPEIQPNIEFTEVSEQDGVSFTAEVVLHPTVKLGQYKGIEAPVIEYNVTDEEVSAEIQKKLNEMATEAAVEDRPVRQGDIVTLDFAGFMGDEQFEGGTAEGYKLKIGSGSFIPGFEEQMVGMNIGDERDINVTFPEDYHAENLAGKPVVFKVKVHAITEENVPELNDEFVQDISECSTVDEYTAYVRGDLEKRAAERAKNERTDLILQKVIDNAEVEIHGDIVSAEVDMQIDRFDKQLQSFGADLKSYLEYAHLSIEDMRKDYEQAAQRQLKSQYVMMAIIDAEKLEPTDEDFREVIAMSDTAKQQHWDDEKIDAELKDNRMKYAVSALYHAAVKMLVANAVVPAAAPAEEAPAAE